MLELNEIPTLLLTVRSCCRVERALQLCCSVFVLVLVPAWMVLPHFIRGSFLPVSNLERGWCELAVFFNSQIGRKSVMASAAAVLEKAA